MSQSMPLLPGSSPESIQLEPFDQSTAGPPPVNPLLKIHKLLAGRYHWAIILGVIFGAIAAASGYLLVPEKYQSSGLIDIKPFLKRIVFPNEQNMVMPMFDSYVSKQIAIMQQQRCIQFAMESGAWTTAGNGKTANRTMLDFADNLGVGKAGELVYVSFVDKDPAVAQAGVKAIINAYQQIAAEKDDEDQRAKQILDDRITDNTRVMKATQDRIDNITKDYGTDDLTLFYTAWATILNNLDQQIVERQEILALSQGAVILETQPAASQPSDAAQATSHAATTQIAVAPGPTSGPATRPGAGPKKLTPEMVATTDDFMKGYLNQKKAIEDDIVRLRHSVAENHPSVLKDKAQLAATQELIDSYQATVQKSMDNGEMAVGLDPTSIRENQIQTSRVQLRALTEIRAQAYNRMIGIAQIMRDVRKLQQDVALSRDTLEKAKAQSEQNSLESLIGNRLIVYSDGDIPPSLKNKAPTRYCRRAAGGLGLGLPSWRAHWLFDRRVKSVADTRLLYDRSNRILGILPSLPDDLTDPDQAATAAFCVHHIRTLLQIGAGARRIRSSPSPRPPGEGKTSLVFSLGLSYAATGVKALLIDFDIIGAGLTSRANGIVRRKIGEVLVRNGVISREQLTDALDKTRKSGKRMGETLIESGVLTQDDLDRALDASGRPAWVFLTCLTAKIWPIALSMATHPICPYFPWATWVRAT